MRSCREATLQARPDADHLGRHLEAGPRPARGRRRQQAGGSVKPAQANLDRLRVLEQLQAHHRAVRRPRHRAQHRHRRADQCRRGAGRRCSSSRTSSKLRVYVNVPQNYVPSIQIGTKAQLSVPEYPGRTFPATVEASAQAVDVASGTTRMQLVVDNADGELMTGRLRQGARSNCRSPKSPINVPASALIFDQSGLRVATVDARQPHRAQAGDDRARPRPRGRDRAPASPPTTVSSPARRTASPTAIRCASPARPARRPNRKPPRRSDGEQCGSSARSCGPTRGGVWPPLLAHAPAVPFDPFGEAAMVPPATAMPFTRS